MKLTAIIVGTDLLCIKRLKAVIQTAFPDWEIAGIADSPAEGAQLIRDVQPSMVFCEIALLGGNAFELLELFPKRNFKVVMISPKRDLALKAFEYGASDFLLKPLSKRRLMTSLTQLNHWLKMERPLSRDAKIRRFLSISNDRIALPTKLGYRLVSFQDIIRIQADGSYVQVFTRKSKPQLISKTLKHITSELNQEIFMRVHRSHLINLHYVKEYCKNDGGYVIMDNGDKVEVASQKKEQLLAKILN